MLRIAVIGLGARAAGVLRIILRLADDAKIVAVADANLPAATERLKALNQDIDRVQMYSSHEALLEKSGDYGGLMIATRDDTHTPIAIAAAKSNLPIYLEKPVAIDSQQLQALHAAFVGREDSVVVSFPLRVTPLFSAVMDVIRSGRLGKINQIQAINNVPYGGVYFGQWYRSYTDCRGLWLQKATHDFDCINQIVGSPPMMIAATSSRLIYGGNMPENLRCSECDITDTCPESPKNIALRGDDGGMGTGDHWCAFSRGIENQDAGSAMLLYANGVHASYSQNFIARRSAGRRGANVIGYTGSLEFDWADNTIRIIDHHQDRVDNITIKAAAEHGGGDEVLAINFIDVMLGRSKSISDLRAGLLSAAMCLAATESAGTRTFQSIPLIGDTLVYDHAEPLLTAER